MENFYQIVLIKVKASDGSYNNPVFSQEANSTLSPIDWAYGKYFSTLSTYWNDSTWSYIAAYMIRSDGHVIESKCVDRRVPTTV